MRDFHSTVNLINNEDGPLQLIDIGIYHLMIDRPNLLFT